MKLREFKAGKHKSLFIVPPRGALIRRMRVKRRFIVLLCVIILCGFAGYFVPFNKFSIDVVEQAHKHTLDEQNRRIASAIKSMGRNLNKLDDELDKLEKKKQEIAAIAGIDPRGASTAIRRLPKRTIRNIDTLVAATDKTYALFSTLMESGDKQGKGSLFEMIPVGLPVYGVPFISSRYGMKKDPFTGIYKMHLGVDFAVPQNAPVIATASGQVVVVDHTALWGARIVIQHAYGFSTVYAHLGTIDVHSGEHVVRGEQIGTAGLSGLTTGVHLHYEIGKNGKAVNPEYYFVPDWGHASS